MEQRGIELSETLEDIRHKIREIDNQLLQLIGNRLEQVKKIGKIKRRHNLPISIRYTDECDKAGPSSPLEDFCHVNFRAYSLNVFIAAQVINQRCINYRKHLIDGPFLLDNQVSA